MATTSDLLAGCEATKARAENGDPCDICGGDNDGWAIYHFPLNNGKQRAIIYVRCAQHTPDQIEAHFAGLQLTNV